MKFLIQHNLMAESQLQLVKQAVEALPHVYVGLIPFSREITSNEPIEGSEYIPYGSTLLTTLGMQKGWAGLHFDLDKFTYTEALRHRSDMLNAGLILPARDMVKFLDTTDQVWFTRPDQDLKHYSGYVGDAKQIAESLRDMMGVWGSGDTGTYALNPSTNIVISKPKEIKAEWRWFIVGGKIVSGSMYRAHGQMRTIRETDKEVISEAQRMADSWLPDDCVVMDTALVGDDVKVIEFNCINSSGFYDNDVEAVFKSLWEYHNG